LPVATDGIQKNRTQGEKLAKTLALSKPYVTRRLDHKREGVTVVKKRRKNRITQETRGFFEAGTNTPS
jgi:hypothetical protein